MNYALLLQKQRLFCYLIYFSSIIVCLPVPVSLCHPAFSLGIHLSSSLFGADGAT